MKILTLIIAYLLISAPSYALPGEVDPAFSGTAASYAKNKARLRALRSEGMDSYGLLDDSSGCNINIGNVEVDDSFQAPDEIVVIIEGDVIQANNCR
ncbi:MAG: Unknown protein [uncultured Thiotrichaceae bacterium]|uniref:Uncharacterized protein n=1 Tax=uncultured Thiotrichaceae bacterium TaxID=298394 RepID=A0A6S6T8Y2_9GAMM|nr:MAG: Unknown protein [uncultured Thiotrichaceae bacterium]